MEVPLFLRGMTMMRAVWSWVCMLILLEPAHAGTDRSTMPSPRGEAIFGHPVDDGPTEAMTCADHQSGWFFDLDDHYRYLTFRTCELPVDQTGLPVTPTSVLLYFHDGQLVSADASIDSDDTRRMRLALRKWFGIPAMNDGRFMEDELFAFKDIRYSYDYTRGEDGLLVAEHLDHLRAIAAQTPPSPWDARLDKAFGLCTTALLDDAPGDLSWPGRPHPWIYPLINQPENEGDATTITLTAHGVLYDDEYGFTQDLPDFGCTYDVDAETAKLITR